MSPDAAPLMFGALLIVAIGAAGAALAAETPEVRLLAAAVAVLCPVAAVALDWRTS